MRHALAGLGGRRISAAAPADRPAADCPAIGVGSGRRNPGQPVGQVAVSAAGIMRPAPTPHRAREPAPARKGGGVRWFRLVVFALVLTGAVATLVKSIWSSHGAPPPL